ncbi:hypothetical protein BC829DRAFT_291471 [Chytridium lagenaria]|nr:hypothetical protein BC829DRAFT_291471 [Chytridium lagenaria]
MADEGGRHRQDEAALVLMPQRMRNSLKAAQDLLQRSAMRKTYFMEQSEAALIDSFLNDENMPPSSLASAPPFTPPSWPSKPLDPFSPPERLFLSKALLDMDVPQVSPLISLASGTTSPGRPHETPAMVQEDATMDLDTEVKEPSVPPLLASTLARFRTSLMKGSMQQPNNFWKDSVAAPAPANTIDYSFSSYQEDNLTSILDPPPSSSAQDADTSMRLTYARKQPPVAFAATPSIVDYPQTSGSQPYKKSARPQRCLHHLLRYPHLPKLLSPSPHLQPPKFKPHPTHPNSVPQQRKPFRTKNPNATAQTSLIDIQSPLPPPLSSFTQTSFAIPSLTTAEVQNVTLHIPTPSRSNANRSKPDFKHCYPNLTHGR